MSATHSDTFGSTPSITSHADRRWKQRSTAKDTQLTVAWQKGTNVELDGRDYHEARLFEDGDAVMLRKNENIVTVLSVDDVQFRRTVSIIS